jgi:hypothetical protein
MSARKLIIFVGKVIILIIIMSSFWHFLAPSYNQGLAVVADKVAPSSMAFRAEDNSIFIDSQRDAITVTLKVHGLSLQYGLIVIIALIAATPGLKLKRRLKFIIAAVIIMFFIHVLAVLTMGKVAQSVSPEHPSVAGSPLEILFVSIGFDLFPILVWVALSFKYWLPSPQAGSKAKGLKPIRQRHNEAADERMKG